MSRILELARNMEEQVLSILKASTKADAPADIASCQSNPIFQRILGGPIVSGYFHAPVEGRPTGIEGRHCRNDLVEKYAVSFCRSGPLHRRIRSFQNSPAAGRHSTSVRSQSQATRPASGAVLGGKADIIVLRV